MDDDTLTTWGTGSSSVWSGGAPGSPSEAVAAADPIAAEPAVGLDVVDHPESGEQEETEPAYVLPPSQFEIPNTQALDNELVRRLEHPNEFTDE